LAVTRAFGDSELKDWIIADPVIKVTVLQPSHTHLVIACDGLWDVASDEDVVSILSSTVTQSAQQLSDTLLQYAITHKTKDNVSIIVIQL